ncbi:MAG TPA: hypothetical protein VLA02_05620 [Reyranella sp.]|nr:hypothetical protein [Reyranella sp.]
MKQRLFGLISALIGIVMALAAIELTAIVWLYLEEGRYVSAEELFQRSQNTYVRDLTKGSACRYVDTLYPHPYVAFVHHANPPCGLPNVNNIGLLNTDFPTLKRDDVYTVLVVGGSVASQLAQNIAPPAPRFLEEELNKRFVSPNGKPFLVLNGGDGAWKEPQSFILFSMYATSVDAVITVDGYNEHYLFRSYTEERLERPLSNFADVNPFVADENFGDAAIGWVMGRVAGSLAQMPVLGSSHAAYMVVRGIEAAAKGRDIVKGDKNKKTTLNSIFALPADIKGNGEKVFQIQLTLYQKYTRAIEAVARDNNVRSAYFLQPVPSWGKVLTEQEKRGAGGNLADPVIYRRMVEGMLTLRDRGMAVYDLGDLLKDVPEPVYADDIHFIRDTRGDSRGYRMMAKRVADDLAKTWNLKEK